MCGSGGIGTYVVILSRVVVNCGLIKYIRANRHSGQIGIPKEVLPKKSHREIQKMRERTEEGYFLLIHNSVTIGVALPRQETEVVLPVREPVSSSVAVGDILKKGKPPAITLHCNTC